MARRRSYHLVLTCECLLAAAAEVEEERSPQGQRSFEGGEEEGGDIRRLPSQPQNHVMHAPAFRRCTLLPNMSTTCKPTGQPGSGCLRRASVSSLLYNKTCVSSEHHLPSIHVCDMLALCTQPSARDVHIGSRLGVMSEHVCVLTLRLTLILILMLT